VVWIFLGEVLFDEAMGVSLTANWTFYFLIALLFPSMHEGAGTAVCFWIFAGICGLGVVYFWIHLFETKGRKKENQQRVMGGNK